MVQYAADWQHFGASESCGMFSCATYFLLKNEVIRIDPWSSVPRYKASRLSADCLEESRFFIFCHLRALYIRKDYRRAAGAP